MESIAPLAERYAQQVREIYSESEFQILQKLAKRIADGKDIDSEHWLVKKLAEIKAFNEEARVEVKHLLKLDPVVESAVKEAYDKGQKWAVSDLKRSNLLDMSAASNGGTKESIRALVTKTVDGLHSTHTAIVRTTNDIYRKVVTETEAQVLTGTVTRREAAQICLDKFAAKGITGFVDKSKRSWDLASYTETAVRTGTANAAREGHLNKLVEHGHDLVVISSSPEPCPLCEPYEGEILSISGESDKYDSLDDAIANGLYHGNCTHRAGAYIEGLTEIEKIEKDPEAYKEKQKQRYYERNIRMAKLKSAVATTPEAEQKAANGLKNARSKMKDFIDESGRKRDYSRESIGKAR